jgi:hypothetical protein
MNLAESSFRKGGLTPAGKASFDWAVLFAAVALLVPASGLVGAFFALRARRLGYSRWKSALAISLWCALLGVMLRLLLHLPVVP